MFDLAELGEPKNAQDPTFTFLVTLLFSKFDGTRKDNLGRFPSVMSKKIWIIEQFIDDFKLHIGEDMFPSSRLIFPSKSRRKFFIRDVTLARIIIKVFNIPKNSPDYLELYHWKHNYHEKKQYRRDQRQVRNLPSIIARIISNRRLTVVNDDNTSDGVKPLLYPKQRESEYTVTQINQLLDNLETCSGQTEQIEILKPYLYEMSIEEIRWLLTIILRQPILHHFITAFFNKWHPQAMLLFRICNDLKITFHTLYNSSVTLSTEDLLLHPMYPFLPQLSHKLTVNYNALCIKMHKNYDMPPKLQNIFDQQGVKEKFYIEEKMDGDRMLLHYKNGQFKFYLRRLKDYTLLYGENYEIGSLTKNLVGFVKPNVDSIVLDGEMVAWDYKREIILPFGTLKSAAIQEAVKQFTTTDQYDQQSSYPFFLAFDILHINGHDLCSSPLFYRRYLLNNLIVPKPHRLEILPAHLGGTPDDIRQAIREVISKQGEGVMIKHVQLKYHIETRSDNWIKVKPEYLEQFGENLDLVVIGKEPQIKPTYACGLLDTETGIFKSFCSVANGFTDKEFSLIDQLTHGKWHKFNKDPPPNDVLEFGTRKPNFWINPKESIVLEIKARSINLSPTSLYAVGTTLHNLWCRSIREDKSIDDCITLQDYLEVKEHYSKVFSKAQTVNRKRRGLGEQLSFEESRERRRKINVESKLFSKFCFIVLSDKFDEITGERTSVGSLCDLIKRFGGLLVQLPPTPTKLLERHQQLIVITERLTPNGSIYVNSGIDLILPKWIFECIYRDSIIPLEDEFIFQSCNNHDFSDKTDLWGDSWIVPSNIEMLEVPKMELAVEETETKEFINDLAIQESDQPMAFLFQGIKFLILANDEYGFLEDRVKRFGGNIVDNWPSASYIISDVRPLEVLGEVAHNLQWTENDLTFIPNTVTPAFVDECIKYNYLADATDFKPVEAR